MIECYERKARFTELKAYCYHSKDNDFIEVCEWNNGEGFDVTVSEKQKMSFTWGEWEALNVLVAYREAK